MPRHTTNDIDAICTSIADNETAYFWEQPYNCWHFDEYLKEWLKVYHRSRLEKITEMLSYPNE